MINKFGKLTLLCLTLEHSLTLFQMKKESLILLLAIAPALALAQDYRREESPPIILKPIDPGAGARPHDTQSQTVTCSYADGKITVLFENGEGPGTLKLREVFSNQTTSFGISTDSEYTVYTGPLLGTYAVTVTTRQNTYEGYITIF